MIVGNSLEKIYWKGMLVFGGNGTGDENVNIPPYEIIEPTEPPTTDEPTDEPINPPVTEINNILKVKVRIGDANAAYSFKPTPFIIAHKYTGTVDKMISATKYDYSSNVAYFDLSSLFDDLSSYNSNSYLSFMCIFDWKYNNTVKDYSFTYNTDSLLNLFNDNGLINNTLTITKVLETYWDSKANDYYHRTDPTPTASWSNGDVVVPTDEPTEPPTTDEPEPEKSLYTNQKFNVTFVNSFYNTVTNEEHLSGNLKMTICKFVSGVKTILSEKTSNVSSYNSTIQFETNAIDFNFSDTLYLMFTFEDKSMEHKIYNYNDTVEDIFNIKNLLSSLSDNRTYNLNIIGKCKWKNSKEKYCVEIYEVE